MVDQGWSVKWYIALATRGCGNMSDGKDFLFKPYIYCGRYSCNIIIIKTI